MICWGRVNNDFDSKYNDLCISLNDSISHRMNLKYINTINRLFTIQYNKLVLDCFTAEVFPKKAARAFWQPKPRYSPFILTRVPRERVAPPPFTAVIALVQGFFLFVCCFFLNN